MGKRGPVPGSAGARSGGIAVKAKYGSDYYRKIGKLGGAAASKAQPREFFEAIGRKGGETTRERYGQEFFTQIGKKGGGAPRKARSASPNGTERKPPDER